MLDPSESDKCHASCLCQGILLEFDLDERFCCNCHCASCRKFTGSAFGTWVTTPNASLVATKGKHLLHKFETSPGSEWISCKHCGSSLYQRYTEAHDKFQRPVAFVLLATIDDAPTSLRPTKNQYWDTHARWLNGLELLPKHVGHTDTPIS